MAGDATLLLELLDDTDEVEAMMMMVEESQQSARDAATTTTAALHSVSRAMLRRKEMKLQTALQSTTRKMSSLPDPDFFTQLRVTKQTFNFLLSIIDHCYKPVYRGGTRPNDSQSALTIALRYLGTTTCYREISQQMQTSESTVFTLVQMVVNILCDIAPEFVCWPNDDEVSEVESRFRKVAGLPGVVGALADMQVKFKYSVTEGTLFINKDYDPTVHVLAICNDKTAFTYVNVGYPGSAEEREVLKSTSFFEVMEDKPLSLFPSNDHHIVANSAYPASKHILVPFRDLGLFTDDEEDFNKRLFQTRLVIIQAFAQLKARFPRLHYIDAGVKKIPKMVKACCVLHNITLMFPEEAATLKSEGHDLNMEAQQTIPLTFDVMTDDADGGKRERLMTTLQDSQ